MSFLFYKGGKTVNNPRRKQLDSIIIKITEVIEELEAIMSDEEEYRDNVLENLQNSERYEQSENACDSMQQALDNLDEAISNIKLAQE